VILGYLLQAVVAALAGLLARRRTYHRPVFRYLALVALSDPLRGLLRALHVGRPLSSLLFVAVPVGLATACAAAWAPALWPHVLGLGALVSVLGMAAFPRGYPAGFLLAVQAGSQLLGWSMFGWELRRGRKHWASPYTISLVLCLASDAAFLLGPYLMGDVFLDWKTGWAALNLLNVALIAAHASWLSSSRSAAGG
jgi:hypothetical protein